MSAQTIRTALGQLQDDPDLEQAWHDLEDAITASNAGIDPTEISAFLAEARRQHASRREWDAVARLLDLEVLLASGSPTEPVLQAELARVFEDELLDVENAIAAYKRLLTLRAGDPTALEALERNEANQERWRTQVEQTLKEVADAPDAAFRSSLLMSAAEATWRYGRASGAVSDIAKMLEEALQADPTNRRAAVLLERIYRLEGKWEDAARVIETLGTEAPSKDERVAAFLRLGRVYSRKLSSKGRAAAAYERALDLSPGHPEAFSYLVEFFESEQNWDHLAALYEDQLRSGGTRAGQESGMLFQIAMVHWRMRNRPDAAEPWFEKLRKLEPAHGGMLSFFREWCEAKKDKVRLLNVLSDAQRALPDGAERTAISAEIARMAEGEANPGKAIEQYKAVLRQDPGNRDARDALKRLYVQTESWNPLVEVLRQELERTSPDDRVSRLTVLREMAAVYKQHIKSDTALVTVLTQIAQLDEQDLDTIRELARVYEALSRWRDLLVYQQKLADHVPDVAEKVALYTAVARRWLEQFSNVQNGIDAYEALLRVEPTNEEARSKLRELYTKRRAWPQLYALSEKELAGLEGSARVEMMLEMAKLAAERLDRGADAIKLYKEALDLDEQAPGVLDALEKQAERDKDFVTVTEVLERRIALASDDATKLNHLQRLGTVFADRLNDPAGAARAWRRVLALQPGHAKALRVLREAYLAANDFASLEELYASQNDWEGLADVLSGAADRTNEPELKVEYSVRAAQVYVEKLKAPERAVRSYERILSVRPDDADAAQALVPIYEREERWQRLPPLYEALFKHADDTVSKVELLRKLAKVVGDRLQDRPASLKFARQAFDLAPGFHEALEFLEQASRDAQSWDLYVEAIEARLADEGAGLEASERRSLKLKLAAVLATEQGKVEQAVTAYRALVEEEPTDEEAISTLDQILRSAGRQDDLRWLFELRVSHLEGVDRAQLLSEWASLEEEVFGDAGRAIALFRRVVEIVPDDLPALSALSRLLLASGDAEGAATALITRRDASEGSVRAERELDLAELYLSSLGRPADALDACIRALELTPGDARAIDLLERLLKNDATRHRAAGVLEAEFEALGEARRQANALTVLLEGTTEPEARLALFVKLTDVQENKLVAPSAALDVVLRATGEFPTEITLWERADGLAVRCSRPTDLAEALKTTLMRELPSEVEITLCERAAALYDERLGNPEGAIPFLDKILRRQPTNEPAFERLKQILTAREYWERLEELYEHVLRATEEDFRKVELLSEVALVCEEITSDNPKAIAYYERILALDPVHEHAIRALDSLYQSEKRPRDLAALLDRRLGIAPEGEINGLKLRLGYIYVDELHEPAMALVHLEEVLKSEQSNANARALVERLLEIASLRVRAAEVLEAVYEARDEVRDLVRVLEIRLEAAENDDLRRELLGRISVLRDQRLQDDAGAFESLARLVPLDPADATSRKRFEEIGRRLGSNERVAAVLSAASGRAESAEVKAEILMDVARIYEDLLNDIAKAEEVYRRVIDLDRTSPTLVLPASHALERIYASTQNHTALAETLRLEVSLESEPDARRELWGRLGDLCETMLSDIDGAISAWRARLEDDAGDEQALIALERLYERKEAWRDLVGALRAREQVSASAEERRRLLVKAAQVLSEKLGDTTESVSTWRSVVDEFGPERGAFAALAALYEKTAEWVDLALVYEQDLSLADEGPARLELLGKLGDVRREHLADLPGAIDAYRQALLLEPSHAVSRAALSGLLDVTEARREAAEILHPLYEADGDHEKLLRVLEIEADTADSPSDKLAVLDQAVRVAQGPLTDASRAFGYATRALREAVTDSSLPSWLERIEELTTATNRYADLIKVLSDIAKDVSEEELQLSITLRVAELAREKLADVTLAREWYRKALEIRSDDRRALVALESIYGDTGDARQLLETLKRRVETSTDNNEQKELLYRQAKLVLDELQDEAQAITVYEAVLDIELDAPAIDALETLYTKAERHEDLVRLYERQLEASPRDPAGLRVKLARVASKHLNDVPRAFDELGEALSVEPNHEGAIAELEGLLDGASDVENRARAGEMLEPVYLRRSEWKKVMKALEARLAASQDPADRNSLLKRLAKLHEEQEENYGAALETTAKLLHEDLSNEETWAELERLAKVATAERRLAEIYAAELAEVSTDEPHTVKIARRTGEIFASLGEIDQALVFYRRALAFDPESREFFHAVDALLIKANRPSERVDLYRAALDHRYEPADRIATLHIIAELEENALSQADRAIETYRAAVDVDERDTRSLDALTRLYRANARWRDLAELYQRRADNEADPEKAATYRLALARLFRAELADPTSAIDQLEQIVQALPYHKEAIAELESYSNDPEHKGRVVEILRPLYERADDWRDLIRLNGQRLQLASDKSEKVQILRETAALYEERAGDRKLAFQAIQDAFDLDPDDSETRAQLDRLAADLSAWDPLAASYERAIAASDGLTQRELLGALAKVHDVNRDDPRRALEAYGRLFAADETELTPLEAMDDLAILLSDWQQLVKILIKKAELVNGDDERAALWRRVGEARRDMLDDPAGAIQAYEQSLEFDAQSVDAVDRLIVLYEEHRKPERLVELYRRRVELAEGGEDDLKYSLLSRAAETYEKELSNRSEAIVALREALDVRANDKPALRALDRLLRAEEQWPDLLENLRLEVANASSNEERVELQRSIGDLFREKLNDPAEALEAYRLVLDIAATDEASIVAVRGLGESQEDLRLTAADVLEPVLRAASRWTDLVGALELRLRAQSEPSERARTLRSVAEVEESRLSRPLEAEKAVVRALADTPEDADLHSEIVRLAASCEGFGLYADALGERAKAIVDAEVAKDLLTRLGQISEEKLSDDQRAIDAYNSAIVQAGDTAELLAALDRLFVKKGDSKALADVLERRVAIEDDSERRADHYFRLATVQIRDFKEPAQGIATLRLCLESKGDHAGAREALEALLDDPMLFDEACETLDNVYRNAADYNRLVALLERRVEHAADVRERIRIRLDLCHAIEEHLNDTARAQAVLETALQDDPNDPDVFGELERLAPVTGGYASVGTALEKAIGSGDGFARDVARDLFTRLAHWSRDRVGDSTAAERAFEKALGKDPESLDILQALEDLRRAPGRERDLVETLRRRAKLESDIDRKRELLREAKTLADTVGDRELAEAVLRQLLADNDSDTWALEELIKIREAADDWKEATELLLKLANLLGDGGEAAPLKHRAAAACRDKLNDPKRATTLFAELFDADPNDREASKALRALYEAASQSEELGRLLERLIDLAESASERTSLRLDLARLQGDKLNAPNDAIDTLRAVLDEEEGHADAVVLLSQLFEKTGKDDDLAELLSSQIELASSRGDTATELTLKVRLGEIYETRLKDAARAIETFQAVLERDPSHKGALAAVARLFEAKSDWAQASAALEKLLVLVSGAELVSIALRLADMYVKTKDDEALRRGLERALQEDDKNTSVREQLRKLYERLGEWLKLADLLVGDADATEAAPEKVKLLRAAADIHIGKRQDNAAGASLLEKASALAPDDRELLLALCDAFSASGRGKDAAAVLEKVVASFGGKKTKELATIHQRLARAYTADGEKEKALTQLDAAFKIDPGSIATLRDLGLLTLEMGDLDRASKTFRALLLQKLDASSPISKGEVFYYLGEISHKQNDKAKAIQMLERAIENDTNLQKARDLLKELKG
ncbi:MAG: tetratricopeptide repeat protein [Polyangiaceae bacterium]